MWNSGQKNSGLSSYGLNSEKTEENICSYKQVAESWLPPSAATLPYSMNTET